MVWVISVRAEVSLQQRVHRRECGGDGVGFAGLDGDLLGDVAQRQRDGDVGGLAGGELHAGVLLVAKPEASTWMVYLPAARLAKAYLPWASEVIFCVAPVASFLIATAAPGSGAPRGSSTVPVRLALDCA